jgi:hypothetical protein
MKIMITESQYRILTEQYSEEQLKTKYVDSELIPQNQFNDILKVTKKPFYRGWLLDMVSSGIIKNEDVYKFEHYFRVFDKLKQHYPIKDLGQIKTIEDVNEFEEKSKDIIIKQQDSEQVNTSSKENLVSVNNLQKLESVGVKYLGITDGYQVFQIPPEVKDNENTWKVYREILGKCSGRDEGQYVAICTMANFGLFRDYLNISPGSSYYVFYNLGDSKSPYQIHFESNQYMDKNDDPITDDLKFKFIKFLLKNNYVDINQIDYYTRYSLNFVTNDETKDLTNLTNELKDYLLGANILEGNDSLGGVIMNNREDKYKSPKIIGKILFNRFYTDIIPLDCMPKLDRYTYFDFKMDWFFERLGIEYDKKFKIEYEKLLEYVMSEKLPNIKFPKNFNIPKYDLNVFNQLKESDIRDKLLDYFSNIKIIDTSNPDGIKLLKKLLIKNQKLILNKDYGLDVNEIPMTNNVGGLIFDLNGFIKKLGLKSFSDKPMICYDMLFRLIKKIYPDIVITKVMKPGWN